MLARVETIPTIVEIWLAQFERALAAPDDSLLRTLFHPDSHWRDVLALTWRIRTVDGADGDPERPQGSRPPRRSEGLSDRSRPHAARHRDPRRHERDRSDLQVRDRRGPRQRRAAAHSGRGGRQRAEGVDAAHRARRTEGPRGGGRPVAAARHGLFARLPRAELARSAQGVGRICRPRSGGADRRRRTGRARGRGAASPVAGRYADRRSGKAHRRQLAQPLSRADPAQPGAGQSLPLHAVSAELADLHPEGQARQLDGGLCRGMELNYWTGTEFQGGSLRRKDRPLVGHAAPRRRQPAHHASAPCRDGDRSERHSEHSGHSVAEEFRRHGAALEPVHRRRRVARQARAHHRHRQQRPRHRAGSARQRRGQRHAGAAQPDHDRQCRAERAAALCAL